MRLNRSSFFGLAWLLVVSSVAHAAPDDLFPRGNEMCFSFYSLNDSDVRHALTNGGTAIGPYYGEQDSHLADALKWNTHLIYKVRPPSMAGKRVALLDQPGAQWPADQTISNEVAAIVSAVRTNSCIAIWDIEPEELRSWIPAELHYLQLVSSAIRANDPLKRPLYMYECNNRRVESLAAALACEDVIVKGTYVNAVDDGKYIHHRIWARWSMEQELGAVAQSQPSAMPWILLWMAGDPEPKDFDLIPKWCRHDAYLGLVMGGKGISIWSGARNRAGFSKPAFESYFQGYLSVARDLNGPLKLAPVFLFGTKQTNVSMTVTSGPARLDFTYQKATNSYAPVTFLATQHQGVDYLFAVNSAEVPVTVRFSGLPASPRQDLFEGGRGMTSGGSFSATLSGLEVKAWRFTTGKPTTPIESRAADLQPAGRSRPPG